MRVTGPNGFNRAATFVSVDNAAAGTPRTATYSVLPSDGSWDGADSGTYGIVVQSGQVKDAAGNSAASNVTAGTFTASIVAVTGKPRLLASSDTGLSSSDRLTNRSNASAASALQFQVTATLAGDVVTLYSDGVVIGSATATGPITVVTTDGSTTLPDGVHAITARRKSATQPQSDDSAALSVTIDTAAPAAPPAPDLRAVSDSGASASDDVTNVSKPSLDLTASEPGTLHLDWDGGTRSAVHRVLTSGTYTLTASSGRGDGLLPRQLYPLAAAPAEVISADFNADGFTDLLATGASTSVLLAVGDGTFQPPRPITALAAAGPTTDVAVGDFNRDGKPDLAIGIEGGKQMAVVLGNGDGSFATTYLTPGSSMTDVAVGDFNRDGNPDVLVADAPFAMRLFYGNGNGTFRIGADLVSPGIAPAAGVTVADLNRDGEADLVLMLTQPTAGVYQLATMTGRGDGNFDAAVSYGTDMAFDFAVGDANGDGVSDFAGSTTDGELGVRLGRADGTFADLATVPGGGLSGATLADFDGDGSLDFVSSASPAGGGPAVATVFRGNGDGTFMPPVNATLGDGATSLAAGRFNEDGMADLATAVTGENAVAVLIESAGPLADGIHPFTAWFEDAAGNRSADSAALPVSIDTTAPTATIRYDRNRSTREITVTLSESPAATIADASALTLVRRVPGGGADVPVSFNLQSWDPATETARFAAASSLDDGNYRVSFSSVGISDLAGNAMAADASTDFFVLSGDADGDRTVGPSDFNLLASHFGQSGQTWSTGDFDGDGVVGPSDFNLLATRFGTILSPPRPPGT